MPDFNPANPKQVWQLPFQAPGWPVAVAFLGSEKRVAAGNQDGQLFIWDLPDAASAPPVEEQQKTPGKAPAPVRSLVGHENGVTRLAVTPDGKTLISASLDRTIRLWDHAAPASGSVEVVVDNDLRLAEARRAGKKEAAPAPGVKVETVGPAHTLTGHRDWINALALSADGRRLVSGDDSGLVICWDLELKKEIGRWTGHPWNWVISAAVAPDGQTAVVSEYRYKRDDFDIPPPALKVRNLPDGAEKLDLLKVQFPKLDPQARSYGSAQLWRKFVGNGLIATAISPDGKLLAAAQGGETDNGQAHLFDLATGKLLRSVAPHQYGQTDVKFTADSQHLVTCGRDTVIRVTRVEDGKEVAALGKPRGGQFKDWLAAIALSPDERWIAAADIAGWVQVWRFEG